MPNQCNYSVVQSALMTGFRTDFTSSVWNFCCWVTDVPPGETSPSGDERGETSVFAGYPNAKPTKNKYKQTENKVLEENFRNTLITLLSYEKVLLFQDIFPVLIVSQEFCILLFDCCFFWFLCWRVGQNAVWIMLKSGFMACDSCLFAHSSS